MEPLLDLLDGGCNALPIVFARLDFVRRVATEALDTGELEAEPGELRVDEWGDDPLDTPQDQFNAWVASSEGHYEAMINPKFREIGLGLAVSDGVAYRCAVFAGDDDI